MLDLVDHDHHSSSAEFEKHAKTHTTKDLRGMVRMVNKRIRGKISAEIKRMRKEYSVELGDKRKKMLEDNLIKTAGMNREALLKHMSKHVVKFDKIGYGDIKESISKMNKGDKKKLLKGLQDLPDKKKQTHKMPNGDIHTGKSHTKDSKLVKRGESKGDVSKTNKGDKDYTTKKGDKDFHEKGKDIKKKDKPFTKKDIMDSIKNMSMDDKKKLLKGLSDKPTKKEIDDSIKGMSLEQQKKLLNKLKKM